MRLTLILFSAAVAAAGTAPAAAQGFRIELHSGIDNVGSEDGRDSGLLYGIGVGYDLRMGTSAFAGIEVNAEDSEARRCDTGLLVANDELCTHTERDLSAAVRAGARVGAGGRAYALLGYSRGRIFSAYTAPTGPNIFTTRDLDGIRGGVGFQQQINGRFYGKLEYRYTNYEDGIVRHQGILGIGITF
ncbi:MAG TPA: outer membrane beta-barrel protein [Allosphingosinicella sp.]|jgi:outer membrane immunogenic protein